MNLSQPLVNLFPTSSSGYIVDNCSQPAAAIVDHDLSTKNYKDTIYGYINLESH